VRECPAPTSTYGFQKLACEYFARGAREQHRLPYTICRPFNCVGIGETRALGGKTIPSGNVRLAMSHVVPDLVQKVLQGPGPAAHPRLRRPGALLHVRRRPRARDRRAIFHPRPSTTTSTSRRRVSTTVSSCRARSGRRCTAARVRFRVESDPPYPHDVAMRVPDTSQGARVLGFEAKTTLSEMLDEVIPWIRREVEEGRL
jgi:nucleoside-diphosphate-sugar epimerase